MFRLKFKTPNMSVSSYRAKTNTPECKRYLEAAIFRGFHRIGSSKNGALRLLAYPLIFRQCGTAIGADGDCGRDFERTTVWAERYAPKVTVLFRLLHEQSLCFTPRCCASVLCPTVYTNALITC